jgi:hypothetical protein
VCREKIFGSVVLQVGYERDGVVRDSTGTCRAPVLVRKHARLRTEALQRVYPSLTHFYWNKLRTHDTLCARGNPSRWCRLRS